jgi:hypothetical protein
MFILATPCATAKIAAPCVIWMCCMSALLAWSFVGLVPPH